MTITESVLLRDMGCSFLRSTPAGGVGWPPPGQCGTSRSRPRRRRPSCFLYGKSALTPSRIVGSLVVAGAPGALPRAAADEGKLERLMVRQGRHGERAVPGDPHLARELEAVDRGPAQTDRPLGGRRS